LPNSLGKNTRQISTLQFDGSLRQEESIVSQLLHLQNINKAQQEIEGRMPLMRDAKMRQRYHFMAPSGWINDPNGLIFFRGRYHFFYQFNPYGAHWGAMHWGHAVSGDLITWEYLPIALAPSESYDNHEQGGCFSGSAIEHNGELYLLYTGVANHGEGFVQTQCLAVSKDGVNFEKYKGNPIVTAPEGYDPSNFRDPKIWEHNGQFYFICGAKKDNLAQALLFRSQNLINWEFVNVLYESRGELGYMWECPDIFPIGNKYVLMFSPMGVHERTTVYLVGDLDYKTGRFHPVTTGEIDWGFDYYAPQSFYDGKGRRIIVAWANAWDWMPWFKDWGPTFQEHWCGSFALPREVRLCEDNTLQFIPVEELQKLRYGESRAERLLVSSGEPYQFAAGDGVAYEAVLNIDLAKSTAGQFEFWLRCSGTHKTIIHFDLESSMMWMDRNNADGWSTGVSRSAINLKDKSKLQIHMFVDQSSIEIFTDNYHTSHSCNIFAGNNQNKNYINVPAGSLYVDSLITWGMAGNQGGA